MHGLPPRMDGEDRQPKTIMHSTRERAAKRPFPRREAYLPMIRSAVERVSAHPGE